MTVLEIQKKLIDNTLNFSEAFELIKKLPRHWHTKEWNEKRNSIIKNHCEQCGTKEGIMVAQHLVHPTPFSDIKNELFSKIVYEELQKTTFQKPTVTQQEIEEFKAINSKKREACPFCKRLTFRQRKTMLPKYFCEKCKNYFDQTTEIEYTEIFKDITTDEAILNYLYIKKEKQIYLDFKNTLYKKHEFDIGKRALLIAIEQHFRYTDFTDVVTFCKRCASKMDLHSNLLCWTCKENYFNFEFYDNCYTCFSDNKISVNPFKKLILEKREENLNYSQQGVWQNAG